MLKYDVTLSSDNYFSGWSEKMIIFIVFLVTLLLDQVTKYLTIKYLALYESIPIIKDIFHLTYIQNRGTAFGILQGQSTFFIIVTLALVGLIVVFYRHLPLDDYLTRFGLGLALGGAIGNLIDRIRLGYVIDFLDFRVWPVFNIADSAIVIAVVMFSYWMLIIDTN